MLVGLKGWKFHRVEAVNPRTEFVLTGGQYSSSVPGVYREIQPRTMELV